VDNARFCEKCSCISFTTHENTDSQRSSSSADSSFTPKNYDTDITGESVNFIVNKLFKNRLRKFFIFLAVYFAIAFTTVYFLISEANKEIEVPTPIAFVPQIMTSAEYSEVSVSEIFPFAEESNTYIFAIYSTEQVTGIIKISEKHSAYNSLVNGRSSAVKLVGMPRTIPNDIRGFVIEDLEDIENKEQFETYFGKYYLDTTYDPIGENTSFIRALLMAFSVFFLIFLWIYWPKQAINSVKRLIQTDSLNYVNDILNGYVKTDPVSRLAFTDTFFYSEKTGVIIRYEDIVWAYKRIVNHSVNFIPTGETQQVDICIINNKTFEFLTQARKKVIKRDSIGRPLELAILGEISRRCPNALIGFSVENERECKRIIGEESFKA
jgi:hypothetical protein